MISLPFYLVLIPYAIVVIFVVIFAVINIFHLIHYGATTFASFVVTFAYVAGMVLIFYFSWAALADIAWQAPLDIAVPSFGPQTL